MHEAVQRNSSSSGGGGDGIANDRHGIANDRQRGSVLSEQDKKCNGAAGQEGHCHHIAPAAREALQTYTSLCTPELDRAIG